MVYPIFVYGQPVLRRLARDIGKDYPDLKEFIANMFETMEKSDGVGLAAPQIGESIRIFVIDGTSLSDQDESINGFRKAFINAKIIERTGDDVTYNEGCLSLPGIKEDIVRKNGVRIQYYDEDFNFHDEVHEGLKARIIQHEYDHIEGKLFIDYLSPLRRRILKKKLNEIAKGIADTSYKIRAVK
jgi:peptide deformylase